MMIATLLLADNDPNYLETTKLALEKEGFCVLTATTPLEARRVLSEQYVDLALLDLRLVDNTDKNDTSGLVIAKTMAPTVPKVLVSKFESFEAAREALGMQMNGLPAAVEFVSKSQGHEGLLNSIRKGLDLAPYFQRSLNKFAEELRRAFQDAQKNARQYSFVALAASIIGIMVILVAGIQGLQGNLEIAIATAIAGMITEAIGYLAFRRSDIANSRRDLYDAELLKIHQFDILLAACTKLNATQELICREKVIDIATNHWFTKAPIGKDNA
jgi:CheY-like chemotaxis protein